MKALDLPTEAERCIWSHTRDGHRVHSEHKGIRLICVPEAHPADKFKIEVSEQYGGMTYFFRTRRAAMRRYNIIVATHHLTPRSTTHANKPVSCANVSI